ncbi:uncharacterized protein ACNS7B_001983 [Menidia menidia]
MTAGKALRLALLLTATLQLTALIVKSSNMDVTAGQEVILKCEGNKNLYGDCSNTTWLFIRNGKPAVTLYENGRFHNDAKTKSDRLSVTANCSLVIKEVRLEDDGLYTCRQYDKSGKEISDSRVGLSVSEGVETFAETTTKATIAATEPTEAGCRWRLVYVPVGLAALSVLTASVSIYTARKGSKAKCGKTGHGDEGEDEDAGNYENEPGTIQHTASAF